MRRIAVSLLASLALLAVTSGIVTAANPTGAGPAEASYANGVTVWMIAPSKAVPTAGAYNPWWHVFLVVYNPAWINAQNFQPVKSVAALDAGEAAGEFLPINPGANPYEADTGIVFLCPLASGHA